MKLDERYGELEDSFMVVDGVKPALRVNTLKISASELVKRLEAKGVKLEKVSFLDNGFFYTSDFSMGSTPEYLQGYYYLQEPASQLPVLVLDPKPGELVLDMAASPGGKTTQISSYMSGEGVIVALDNNSQRLKSLNNNLERLAVPNVLVYNLDARYADNLGLEFDKVLLDAPCSGNFCVERDFFNKRSVSDFKFKAEEQKKLLRAALKCLKKDGFLVYSTCSLEPEEDEFVVNWLVENFDVEVEETGLSVGLPGSVNVFGNELSSSVGKTKKLWPHLTGTQGFFIARIRKC